METIQINALSDKEIISVLPGLDGITPTNVKRLVQDFKKNGRPQSKDNLVDSLRSAKISNRYINQIANLISLEKIDLVDPFEISPMPNLLDAPRIVNIAPEKVTPGEPVFVFVKGAPQEIRNAFICFNDERVSAEFTSKNKSDLPMSIDPLQGLVFSKLPSDVFEFLPEDPDLSGVACLSAMVPEGVIDYVDISTIMNGFESEFCETLDVLPKLVAKETEEGPSTLIVQGSSQQQIVEVLTTGSAVPDSAEYYVSEMQCGINSVPFTFQNIDSAGLSYTYSILETVNATLASPSFYIMDNLLPNIVELVQFVQCIEVDEITKKKKVAYFFMRDGKYFRVLDINKKFPGDDNAVDVRDDVENPNFRPATVQESKDLDLKLFPTDWQKAWQGFDEATARQLQIMSVIGLTQLGFGQSEIELILKIRTRLEAGKSPGEIWDELGGEIIQLLLVSLAITVASAHLSKFFGFLFKGTWVKKIIKVATKNDDVTISIASKYAKSIRVKELALSQVKGKVNRQSKMLLVNGFDDLLNMRAFNRFEKQVYAMINIYTNRMVEFAKTQGLKLVKVVLRPATEKQAKELVKMGFKKFKPTAPGEVGVYVKDVLVN